MSVKIIPERKITICDCCGQECGPQNHRHESKLVLTRAALDLQGCAVADGSIRMDLCDNCMSAIAGAVNTAAEVIRSKKWQRPTVSSTAPGRPPEIPLQGEKSE